MNTHDKKILIVDDEADIRRLIRGILEDEGYQVIEAENATKAYEQVETQKPHLAILDIWLQGSAQDGLEILQTLSAQSQHLPIIMISGHGTIETAVKAIKNGAYDFIEKPFKSDRLLIMIKRAIESSLLKTQNARLRDFVGDDVGRSKKKLSNRPEDIPALCSYFWTLLMDSEQSTAQKEALTISLSQDALKILQAHTWTGGTRELRNMMEWIMITHGASLQDGQIHPHHLPLDIKMDTKIHKKQLMQTAQSPMSSLQQNTQNLHSANPLTLPLREARASFEKSYLQSQVQRFEGHVSNMAEFVGMDRAALHRKLKSLNISTDVSNNDNASTKKSA